MSVEPAIVQKAEESHKLNSPLDPMRGGPLGHGGRSADDPAASCQRRGSGWRCGREEEETSRSRKGENRSKECLSGGKKRPNFIPKREQRCIDMMHGSEFRQDKSVDLRKSANGVVFGHKLCRSADPGGRSPVSFRKHTHDEQRDVLR